MRLNIQRKSNMRNDVLVILVLFTAIASFAAADFNLRDTHLSERFENRPV